MINHLAIIMDGNRRWAKERFLASFVGHKKGGENVKKVLKYSNEKGIKYLTLWALSTENIKGRSKEELNYIYSLIEELVDFSDEMKKEKLKLQIIGDLDLIPQKTKDVLEKITKETQENNGLVFTLAVGYGGRDEIIRGIKKLILEGVSIDDLNEESFRKYLDTDKIPHPDVIVRTGGDIRHSGFLLYDSAYSEYYFTKTKWPDFDEKEIDNVIDFFSKVKRNFGK